MMKNARSFDRSHGRRDKGPMTSGPALMVQTSKARLGEFRSVTARLRDSKQRVAVGLAGAVWPEPSRRDVVPLKGCGNC